MLDRKIWPAFWHQLQLDAADTLQNQVLNFSTFVAAVSAYIKIFHPEYSQMADNFMITYLTVLPKVKS